MGKFQNYHTLIACLPNESKEVLRKNEIIISISISKPPLFNYVSFIKNLSIYDINYHIKKILENHQHITSQNLNNDQNIEVVTQEIYKMLMNQVSLNSLSYYSPRHNRILPNIPLIIHPGAIDCLRNLSELYFSSNVDSELFYQLSQVCHNIQSLNINLEREISSGLFDLISVQQNLKYLTICNYLHYGDSSNLIHSLTKLPDTLIKIDLFSLYYMSLSFLAKFIKLREIVLTIRCRDKFIKFSCS